MFGFKHTAYLLIDGDPVEKVTMHYLNRTWERYTYESVISKLLHKAQAVGKKKGIALSDFDIKYLLDKFSN